jgi:hypothetical protein
MFNGMGKTKRTTQAKNKKEVGTLIFNKRTTTGVDGV